MKVEHQLARRPIYEVPLAFVDVETTGLWAESGDRVCEVAVLRIEPDGSESVFSSLANPGRPIEPAARAVNGLDERELAAAPLFRQIIDGVTEHITDAVVVAHNAEFDAAFLAAEYAIARQTPPEVVVLDTLALARRLFSFPRNNLGALALEFGAPQSNRHRAEGDVRTLRRVFDAMMDRLGGHAPWTVGDLMRAQQVHVSMAPPSTRHLTEPLRHAIETGCPVTICYEDAYGQVTERVVEPLWANGTYFIGFCRLVRGQRTFRLDRIDDAWVT